MTQKKAIIIGAGPAGLTAAWELLTRTDIIPVILEKSADIGGISKTVNYKGNRIDIGGHRFFSKSDRVMRWWMDMMPVQQEAAGSFDITYQNRTRNVNPEMLGSNPVSSADPDKVMLVRQRLSRIYFLRRFFTYPIQLSLDTLTKLGVFRTVAIMVSYLAAQLFPRRQERNLEDFMVNRFGQVLYRLFFKDYTEKVWGLPCNKISAEWGAQRIKGVSISKALQHAIQSATKRKKKAGDIAQKGTETSLIEQFLYPKFGPGQLWEEVARKVEALGGKILMQHDVKRIYASEDGTRITAVAAINHITGETSYLEGDYFFSTMPVQELIGDLTDPIPDEVKRVAEGLQYRDFITVGVLLKKLSFLDKNTGEWKPITLKDTWIYIQEKDVKVGRLQIFNNWSPFLVKDPDTTWVGMEFFCNETDDFWKMADGDIKKLAIAELEKIGLASQANVLDSTVLRMEKTYPAYFGTYEQFDVIKSFINRFGNLFLVGRNGMHKYNNSDHSMLTAMTAVDNIIAGITTKENIWSINTEMEYHEEKAAASTQPDSATAATAPAETATARKEPGLKDFIFRTPANKWFVWAAILAIVAQFSIFKFLYPFAGFINGDSYVYLETAYWNYGINTYPVGYSKFLRLFSVFSRSDTVLVGFQYLLLQASVLSLVFTLFYFFKPSKLVRVLLFTCMLFNPIFLYLSNYVSSDALFLSLSLIWFNLLLWIAYRPSLRLVILHGIVLYLAFMVRYNALFYPVIAAVAFVLSRQRILMKIAGFALALVLIGLFVQTTSKRYQEVVGTKQFSPFTGWQLANNALYAYRYVPANETKKPPARFRELDGMVRTFFDSTRDEKKHPEEMLMASTVYMWSPGSPLRQYLQRKFAGDSTKGQVTKWATVAPFYADYGSYLIREYPVTFVKYYLLPNALKYYIPPVEFLDSYNTGVDSVMPLAQTWFGYKSSKVTSYFKDFRVKALDFYPIMAGIINVVFLLSAIAFVLMQGYRQQPILGAGLILVGCLWFINFGFSVFAAPIALRFQLFPMLVYFSFITLFMEYLWKAAK